ncbi:GNAT family N-acetyltransferase [Thermobispora bispora]|jgi:ribosomal protein S18 acetylase RimI-like enzyme|uniref:GCN5-related N-acetyltransferase n=1 Tax=Thermobispora bispora (strain ATCC 19993 / DSM 43833 / CBS 139.67 / JCM 10125 / KCTC 9307 / NBRC 14880 / R51) TaxID=469371 RepID=D6Y4S2_THEBD|nr:GNAT family N-acetyltransferase [Thermobispora bispora]MBO2475434.1 N-acetyltransferase [Actinomycetales bacterium]MDI9580275.1 GNAT family N-acetyltransferase [Thermobispora sp.]ADG89248.1 GCN5-related N-acetyltransferase [Thermobispora bispora DSM 43833]MBX6167960.1 GNAT family N-acetyltransferase [Thermobispora bispora]QSI48926.1 GNAT family N-acetyltransferase [Thermobispora bispora]
MTKPLRIRRYRWSDLDAVWTLHQIALAQVGLVPGDGVYYDDDFPRITEVYLANRGEFLVGEVEGAGIVAMGGLRRIDDRTAEMCRLRVHPDHQRRGYGTQIMLALEQRARELGYAVLRGDTTLRQTAALELYRKAGWRELRREKRGENVVLYGEKYLISELSPFCVSD